MEFYRASLSTCHQSSGVLVVIDVLRAFTTAAYALAAGAEQILLVSSVQEAFDLRAQTQGALLMGEVDGLPIPGFDFGNSPYTISRADLKGRTLIQRTSSGTQGVTRSLKAARLLPASFCVAAATARFIQQIEPEAVTFVITGAENEGGGDEDQACADYLEALLSSDRRSDPAPYLERVRRSAAGRKFIGPLGSEFMQIDLEYAVQVDRFDFAMEVERPGGLLKLRQVLGS